MPAYPFVTVDVFTDRRFGGNPLAVFPDASGLSDADMQALAAEFNLSETTFVLPPDDPANTAKVRIFNRTYEMPFAGHPNVGTAYVLAQAGLSSETKFTFEELAGLVEIQVERDDAGEVLGAEITTPQPLFLGDQFDSGSIARCVSLSASDVLTTPHHPCTASMGNPFVIAEVSPDALGRAAPDLAAFRRVRDVCVGKDGKLAIHLYAWDGARLRARMFSPLSGTFEDPATGSANAPLVGLLLSLRDEETLTIEVVQGVEMGRPSVLRVTAFRASDGIRARVGGRCVPVLKGLATV